MPERIRAEPEPMPAEELRSLTRIALYAALVGAGAFLHVPVGPMHISLQTMMLMLAGFMLGPGRAALAMCLYVACGFLGIPVFGRGLAGPGAFAGPTAGYFLGFIPGAALAGCGACFGRSRGARLAAMIAFGLAGTVTVLALGALLLRWRFVPDWSRAMTIGFYPYVGGDIAKMLAAAVVKESFFPGAGRRKPRHA